MHPFSPYPAIAGHSYFYPETLPYMMTRRPFASRLCLLLGLLLAALAGNARADHVAVEISGVDNGLKKQLLEQVTLTRQNNIERLTLARIRALFGRARKEIRQGLQAHGYYQPRIEARLTGAEEEKEHWLASFLIDPGPRTRVVTLSLQLLGAGREDERLRSALEDFPLKQDDYLDHALYEQGKKQIENLARERGYFDAAWQTHVIRVDVSESSARIDLVYDTGSRYRFGRIALPDTVVSETLLERMLPFEEGDPFDANRLIELTQALRNSDYFSDVLVTPELDKRHDGRVPINVSVTPRPRNSFRVGGGFGTDTGPRLKGSWDSRYFNKRGHRIETDLRLSFVLSSLTGTYLIPYFRNRDAELGLTASVAHEDTDTSKSDTFQTGAHHLRKRWGWNEKLGLTYQYERFELADSAEATHLLIPSIGYWKSVSDDPIYTRKGFRLGLDLQGAVENVISDLSFLQGTVHGKFIHGLGERGRIITRAKLGGTWVSDFPKLPASLRFFAGGDNSVRGFDYEALGPTNADGEVVGGRYLITGSLEYEHRFLEKWSGAVFTDFGNAFNDLNDYELEYSVGAGVRWLTPVGLIRVDLAAGISRDDVPLRLHIVVGPDL